MQNNNKGDIKHKRTLRGGYLTKKKKKDVRSLCINNVDFVFRKIQDLKYETQHIFFTHFKNVRTFFFTTIQEINCTGIHQTAALF